MSPADDTPPTHREHPAAARSLRDDQSVCGGGIRPSTRLQTLTLQLRLCECDAEGRMWFLWHVEQRLAASGLQSLEQQAAVLMAHLLSALAPPTPSFWF